MSKYILIDSENYDENQDYFDLQQENEQLKEEIARLKEINEKVYKYLDEKKDVPEWWDTDFMICMDMLKGGNGNLIEILGDKE